MLRRRLGDRLCRVLCLLLLVSIQAHGQNEPPAIATLRRLLNGQTLTVKVAGVHAATRVLLRPIDNRIVAGAVQPRKLDLLRGQDDFMLAPGSAVQVVRVESATDAHNDILRLGVNASGGGYASLAFPVPRGSLGTAPAQQLGMLLRSVFDGPALASLGAPPAPPSSTSASTSNQNLTTAAADLPSPPTAKPAHPSNNVLDFPPAAPGFPPLHASRAAEEGCWWAPVLVAQYSLEMLAQRCSLDHEQFGDKFIYAADKTGVSMGDPGEVNDHIFDVVSKPAGQSITAAIHQTFIAKLKSPAARANCSATLTSKTASPTEIYEAHASGAYARQARFHRDDDSSDDPCPGLAPNDAVTMFFQYTPSNSRTHYLYFQYQDVLPIDTDSVRFSSEVGSGEASTAPGRKIAAPAAAPHAAAPQQ